MKHSPLRTCVGCREVLAKRTLTRIVRTADGVRIDPTGKMPGRGAYLHDNPACWEIGLKGALAQALKTDLSFEEQELLKTFAGMLGEKGNLSE